MIEALVANMLTSIISVQNTTKGREKTNDDGRPCCALLALGLLEKETHDCCECLSESQAVTRDKVDSYQAMYKAGGSLVLK